MEKYRHTYYDETTMISGEEWKDIDIFPGYKVSNFGRIISTNNKIKKPILLKIVNGKIAKTDGNYFGPHKKGRQYGLRVDYIVAMYFLNNPNNYPCIKHKNGDDYDDKVTNLEWVVCEHQTTKRLDFVVYFEKWENGYTMFIDAQKYIYLDTNPNNEYYIGKSICKIDPYWLQLGFSDYTYRDVLPNDRYIYLAKKMYKNGDIERIKNEKGIDFLKNTTLRELVSVDYNTVVEKGKTHFVVFLEEDDNCTARIYDNFGLVLFDNCYTFDLYPGCIINPDNYEIVDRIKYNEKGWKHVKQLREKIESGKIPQSDYE